MKPIDRDALLEYRAHLKKQLQAELKACSAKWRRKIDAVTVLLEDAPGLPIAATQPKSAPPPPPAALADGDKEPAGASKANIMELVRQAVAQTQGDFSVKTLVKLISKTAPGQVSQRDLSNPLWRLHKLGEIKVVQKGKGRSPSVYVKQ